MTAQNFVGFITVVGFFIAIIFAIIKMPDIDSLFTAIMVITSIFYMLALVSSSFFVRTIVPKPRYRIYANIYESLFAKSHSELRQKEVLIKDGMDFIKKLEMAEFRAAAKAEAARKAANKKTKSRQF